MMTFTAFAWKHVETRPSPSKEAYPDDGIVCEVTKVSELPTDGCKLFAQFSGRLCCAKGGLEVFYRLSETHDCR